jgi:hypothetical protein
MEIGNVMWITNIMWIATVTCLMIILLIVVVVMVVFGNIYWQNDTQVLRQRSTPERDPIQPCRYNPKELENLPTPVQRYFKTVLTPGQRMIMGIEASHTGQFSLAETQPKWMPFHSQQLSRMQPVGFDWDGRIRIAPGIECFVHDAYVAGEGILHATLFGLLTLTKLQGTPEIAQGELLRFLAESAWYPTALLPSQGVIWEAIDDRSARALLTDGATTVAVIFRFGDDGFIQSVYTPARYRTVQGKLTIAPWQCQLWNYQKRDGMMVPIDGEVAWALPSGLLPYWRGHLSAIKYELAN